MRPGFFDDEDWLAKLEELGDPLPRLDSIVDWQAARPLLQVNHRKDRKSKAGRKPHDVILKNNKGQTTVLWFGFDFPGSNKLKE
jgi:transposase, IS5 family